MSNRTEQELRLLAKVSKLEKENAALKSGQSLHASCHDEMEELRDNIEYASVKVRTLDRAYRAAAKVAQEAHRKVHGAPRACFPLDQPERVGTGYDGMTGQDIDTFKKVLRERWGMVDE